MYRNPEQREIAGNYTEYSVAATVGR